jgi:hypothetical protein
MTSPRIEIRMFGCQDAQGQPLRERILSDRRLTSLVVGRQSDETAHDGGLRMSLRNKTRKMPQVIDGARRKMPQVNIDGARLQDAQEIVSKGARQAAQRVGPTTRQARKMAAKQMKNARHWSAPRIDQAGQYIEEEVGPRVGAMLHRTADKVEPSSPQRRRGLAAMLLIVGGAVGAAGAIATRRSALRSAQESGSAERLSAVSEDSSTEQAHSNN